MLDETRLKRIRTLMFSTQRIWAKLELAEKEWRIVVREAQDLGFMIDKNGELKHMDRFRKKAKKSINYMGLSEILSGGLRNIRTNTKPLKYAREAEEIEAAVTQCFKNFHSRKMNNNKNARIREAISRELKLSKKDIRKFNKGFMQK